MGSLLDFAPRFELAEMNRGTEAFRGAWQTCSTFTPPPHNALPYLLVHSLLGVLYTGPPSVDKAPGVTSLSPAII